MHALQQSLTLSAVQLVPVESVDAVKKAFQKLLTFTETVVDGEKSSGPKREPKLWTPDAAKKCRRLSKSPTEAHRTNCSATPTEFFVAYILWLFPDPKLGSLNRNPP